jgi:L-ascorbate metabolism protein UlaG (beta-lactamase superfamily)
MLTQGGFELTYLEHDTFRIRAGGLVVYTDPFQIMPQNIKGDIVTITHDHYDHMSESDLRKVTSENTIIIASVNCADKLKAFEAKEKLFVKPGSRIERLGLTFEAVPAYNINKFRGPGIVFHPREYLGVGFVIDYSGSKLYHAGDTDNIQEMGSLKDISVALLPVSGTYVMTPEEASKAAAVIRADVSVPMHWGAIVGKREDALKFQELASADGVKATVMEKSST